MPSKQLYTVFMREAFLPKGYVGIYWRRSHQKKTVPVSVSWRVGGFSQRPGSGWSWSGELHALSLSAWCMDVHLQLDITPDIQTSRPMPQTDSWSSLPPSHVGRQAPNWNQQHGFRKVFGDNSRINIVEPANAIYFLQTAVHLPVNNTTKNSGVPILVDFGLISKYHKRSVLGSNSWSRPTTGPVYTVGLDNQVRD